MTELKYWLWLTLKKELSVQKITLLLEHFETPKELFDAEGDALLKVPGLRSKERRALEDKSLRKAQAVIEICKKKNIKILTFDSPYYPELLASIYDPPYVLYARCRERIDLNSHATIALVGTRKATKYGKEVARSLGKALAEGGMTLVSGLAEGIDAAALTGALSAGGTVVSVLGCGVDICYPEENRKLMDKIIDRGLLLSEFPPGTPPKSKNFPIRNRIISGLSLGVVVAEAPKRSGALITAHRAAEQNRELFTIPADVGRTTSKGSNGLLHEGAKPVLGAEDILSEFRDRFDTIMEAGHAEELCLDLETERLPEIKQNKQAEAPKILPDVELTEKEQAVLNLLSEEPVHFDRMTESGLAAGELLATLTTLEMKGLIRALPGRQYRIDL